MKILNNVAELDLGFHRLLKIGYWSTVSQMSDQESAAEPACR